MKNHTSLFRGFTLIELLVVIAIIGILSGIVLAALGSSRAKASDLAVKGQMHSIRTAAAEEFYIVNGSYGSPGTAGVCTGGTAGTMWQDTASNMAALATSTATLAGGAANVDCGSSSNQWSMAAKLPSGSYWCIDSTGTARNFASTTGTMYTQLSGAGGAKSSVGGVQCN